MKQWCFPVVLLLLLFPLLNACGTAGIAVSSDADSYTAARSVLEVCEGLFQDAVLLYSDAEAEEERIDPMLASLYFGSGTDDIDMTMLCEYAIAEAAYASASQFGILRVSSAEETAKAVKWIEDRFIRIANDFSSYLPEEEAIAEGVEIKTADTFVYYAASRDNDAVFRAIEAQLIIRS